LHLRPGSAARLALREPIGSGRVTMRATANGDEIVDQIFCRFANATAWAAGRPATFLICIIGVVIWALAGPFFDYSQSWQLVINTITTIITFLMVFLIQNTQYRDSEALQAKLDELIKSSAARNDFIGIEKLSDGELVELHEKLERSARRTQTALKRTEQERQSRSKR
jgi:low affinity Fe/Cu permease